MSANNKSKAAILTNPKQPLEIIDLEIPKLKPGQVLVDIAYSGLCRTQLNEANGLKGEDKFLPHCMGHEGSGIVTQIANGISKVKPGDRVVLSWLKGSGQDVPSTTYNSSLGKINSGAICTFMTKSVISENRLTKIPDAMPLREAALLGCAIPTGAGIVMNQMKLAAGNSIAIFGAGGIGLSAILAAELANASTIIAIDIKAKKLELARELGATHTINANSSDVQSEIYRITNGLGCDFSIDAAGTIGSMENAFKAVRDQCGLCVLAGNLSFNERISIDPFDLIRGKQIVGSWGGNTVSDTDIPHYCELFIKNKLRLSKLITNEFALHEINLALETLETSDAGRIMIVINSNLS